MNIELSDRSQLLMKMLVERYIKDGQPVGSKALSDSTALTVSPATIRNTMKQLEDLGLIKSPHTSAGRVPTEQGYRFYVDSILNIQPFNENAFESLQNQLDENDNHDTVVQKASSLLSELTQMAGVVMVPKPQSIALRQVEFMPLEGNQILAVLVINNQEIQNRIISTDKQYSRSELEQAANYLNMHFAGKDIAQMGQALKGELLETKSEMNHLMELVVQFTGQVTQQQDQQEQVIVDGQANLIGNQGLNDMEKLKQLFDAFQQKTDIMHLLDRCVDGDGVQIFIGHESGYEPLDKCSVVTAPYSIEGETLGVLGVIGPTRMSYERVVPVVDMTAKIVSSALAGK